MINLLKTACVLMALCFLSACVSTRVTGQRVGAVGGKVDKIGVYIQPDQFNPYEGGGIAASQGNRHLRSLVPNLQQRVPLVLMANGIESKAVMGGTVVQNVPLGLDGYEYILRILPKASSYSSRGGSSLTVSAEVYRRGKGYVWAGTVQMNTLGFGKFESALADEVAHDLLVLLARDGVVSLGPIQMPKPAEPEPNVNPASSKLSAPDKPLTSASE